MASSKIQKVKFLTGGKPPGKDLTKAEAKDMTATQKKDAMKLLSSKRKTSTSKLKIKKRRTKRGA